VAGPHHGAAGRLGQLHGDPHARAGLAQAAGERVGHSEIAAHGADVNGGAAIASVELREITISSRSAESALTMSSTMPSPMYTRP
jgi:hypothetical protein